METETLTFRRRGPLYQSLLYMDTKDPCPVFDGKRWHIYGSGGSSNREAWQILHASAEHFEGPWRDEPAAELDAVAGVHVAAPGVVYDFDAGIFHMFVQTDFMALDSRVEHLTSTDGHYFKHVSTVIGSRPGTNEAGVYDPHPAVIQNEKYITYSGFSEVGKPDIFLAHSPNNTWYGPWERIGLILKHEEVSHHNQLHHEDYEWGLEGSQIIELAPDCLLLNAVCFLPEGERGTRQRVFFAVSNNVRGPFYSLGPVVNTELQDWESGENGHASIIIVDNMLHLFYQARSIGKKPNVWQFGIASVELESVLLRARKVLMQKKQAEKVS